MFATFFRKATECFHYLEEAFSTVLSSKNCNLYTYIKRKTNEICEMNLTIAITHISFENRLTPKLDACFCGNYLLKSTVN